MSEMAIAREPSATKGILLIVKRELGQYGKTRTGYIIAGLVLLLEALLYNFRAVGSTPQFSNDVLATFIHDASGANITAALFISMRLIAEERQNGTMPLLATSSLSEGQLVFAKFLSGLAFLSILIAITIYMPALVFLHGKVSLGHIAIGYFGILLIGGAVLAIGIFASALASSQLVAIVVSASITVLLLLLWIGARKIEGTLGDLIEYLAIHNKHFRPFMDGTLSLSSVVFYLSTTVFFLTLARNTIEARRWRP